MSMFMAANPSTLLETSIPEILIQQTTKQNIGDRLKIKGTYRVKERDENGIRLEITGLYLEDKSRHA